MSGHEHDWGYPITTGAPMVCKVDGCHARRGIAERLEELRAEIHTERISWGELAELQGLADYIDRGDVELLQWAGVPEDGAE